jgi:hypothetical protein
VAVVLLIAGVVIVGGVAVVAMGRGGEMAHFSADIRPLKPEIETAADVALLRPPAALWGYDKRATDDALNAVALSVTERDVEIAALRQQLADMRGGAPAGTTWDSAQTTPQRQAPAPGQADVLAQNGPPGQGEAPGMRDWSAWGRPIPPRPEDHERPGATQ